MGVSRDCPIFKVPPWFILRTFAITFHNVGYTTLLNSHFSLGLNALIFTQYAGDTQLFFVAYYNLIILIKRISCTHKISSSMIANLTSYSKSDSIN